MRFESQYTDTHSQRTQSAPPWGRRFLSIASKPRFLAVIAAIGLALGAITGEAAASDAPCDEDAIVQSAGRLRPGMAASAIERHCIQIPGPTWSAVVSGSWEDNFQLSVMTRAQLVSAAVAAGYAEAESLSVQLLENGAWPDETALDLETGALIVKGLEPAMTPYRVHLLLDIYEQVPQVQVQKAVIETLRSGESPEALLPALDAFWRGHPELKEAAIQSIHEQPEESPQDVLTRVIEDLPKGPLLDWAKKIANLNDVAPALDAAKSRGE